MGQDGLKHPPIPIPLMLQIHGVPNWEVIVEVEAFPLLRVKSWEHIEMAAKGSREEEETE